MPIPSLQGKEEFEKTQKELLEKGNIIRQSKDQLEHQQVMGRVCSAGHSSCGSRVLGSCSPFTPCHCPGPWSPLAWLSPWWVLAHLLCQRTERSLARLSWGWHYPLL